MRWFWIDRFIEFNSGVSAKAIKNVSLSEEHIHDHFPSYPIMPCSLMLEGMAQAGGILLGESHKFSRLVFLAKVPKVIFHDYAIPGDQIVYSVQLQDSREEGGMVTAQATCGDRLLAEAEIVFAQLSATDAGVSELSGHRNVVESGFGLVMLSIKSL